MLSALLLLLQASGPVTDKSLPTLNELQFEECSALARKDPASAVMEASLWSQQGGGYLAKACHGLALANDFRFTEARVLFAAAAQEADSQRDSRAARFWAQAGNAAIVADQPADALSALDTALASNVPSNPERADIEIDRARALVALKRDADAVSALTSARGYNAENGTAWLLSATLARRTNALSDALTYIKTAALITPRDAAVALEAGNIAIAAGDEVSARKQWEQAIAIAPASRQATTARVQLSALGNTATPPATVDQSR